LVFVASPLSTKH